MKSKAKEFCPEEVTLLSRQLGVRIATARKRRKLRQEDLASRTRLSRSTIQAIERGEITCSVGALFNVLWSLGLAAPLKLIADPGLDRDGLNLSISADSARVFIPRKVDNAF